MNGQAIDKGYLGNKNLKRTGIQQNFTKEQVEEWIRCSLDPIYFIEKYIKIVSVDHGLVPMKLYDFQKEMVNLFMNNRNSVVACARQLGKSTVVAAFFCHFIIFNDEKTCAILANKASTSREILSRVQLAYEYLPKWIQHGVREWNKGSFELENGSRILAAATSSSAIRGFSLNLLFLDEFAFINQKLAEEFFTSVYPTIASGKTSKLIMVSTPNGMNHFYKFYSEATEGINGFGHLKATWRSVPTRDDKWAAEQRAVLGDTKFRQEMEVEFIGSEYTLISAEKLRSIPIKRPIHANSYTSVYEKPAPGRSYVIAVDTSRGTGNDYSAFIVFDVTEVPYKVVAKYRNNTISSMLYPGIIHKVATEYNDAAVVVETNDVGEGIANALYYELEYEMVMCSIADRISTWGGAGAKPGLRTTTKVKRVGCDTLKQLVEQNKLVFNDAEILFELSNFAQKGKSYEAEIGNDDLAMCLVIFAYFTTQPAFEDVTNEHARQRVIEERMKMVEEEQLPIGFFSEEETMDKIDPVFGELVSRENSSGRW